MCGFIGYISNGNKDDFEIDNLLKDASKSIQSRGPDEESYLKVSNVYFAFRRLAIQDIKNGSQPLRSHTGNNIIVFNGEIYNHLDLRKEYLADHHFKTNSDTETLVELIEKFSIERILPLLNGMFSFACFNKIENKTIIARDRFGIKPLFFSEKKSGITFSSEITPIIKLNNSNRNIDYLSFYRLLVFWYICEPSTIYKDIKAIPPGAFCTISNELKISVKKWWNPQLNFSCHSQNEFIERLNYLLEDSISLRLLSDVPITSLLSGGIDSGLITSYWNKLSSQDIKRVFTLSFDKKSYDESSNAQKNADKFGIPLVKKVLKQPTIEELIELYSLLDQPIANSSFIGSAELFREVNNYSYKVCLTGDGADELFGGYPTYQMNKLSLLWDFLPNKISSILKGKLSSIPVSFDLISLDYKIKQFLKSTEFKPHHPFYRSVFTPDLAQEVCAKLKKYNIDELLLPFLSSINQSKLRGLSNKNTNLHLDFDTFLLNDHLPKIDRSSMAFGVEARNPFLDFRIYELAFSNPHFFKYSTFSLKKCLKIMAKKSLHPEVLKGKKKGLTIPISFWLTTDLGNDIESLILNFTRNNSFLSKNNIKRIFKEHREYKQDFSREIWSLASFVFWTETHKINL